MAKPGPKQGYRQTAEHIANRSASISTHGATKGSTKGQKRTREYLAWCDMKTRCRRAMYLRIKGITVCPAWARFEVFLQNMGPCPKGWTLERINNRGNYEPSNCRWATRSEQVRNRAITRWITYKGETLCLTDWARRLGMHRNTLELRLARGYTIGNLPTLRPGRTLGT